MIQLEANQDMVKYGQRRTLDVLKVGSIVLVIGGMCTWHPMAMRMPIQRYRTP